MALPGKVSTISKRASGHTKGQVVVFLSVSTGSSPRSAISCTQKAVSFQFVQPQSAQGGSVSTLSLGPSPRLLVKSFGRGEGQ